jgi:uncharacterized iron-regulated membrane protein
VALSLLLVALVLWPFVLLGRWLWKEKKPTARIAT